MQNPGMQLPHLHVSGDSGAEEVTSPVSDRVLGLGSSSPPVLVPANTDSSLGSSLDLDFGLICGAHQSEKI